MGGVPKAGKKFYSMKFRNFINSHLTPVSALIAFEMASVFLMSAGFIPREFSLFLLAAILIFSIFSSLKEGLKFFVFSIPFFVSLAVSDSFDSMSSWRVVLLVLFLKSVWVFLGDGKSAVRRSKALLLSCLKNHFFLILAVFFLIGFASLFVSEQPIYGIRKIIFLANIFALFFVVYAAVKNREDIMEIMRFAFAGSLSALFIGYGQFIATLFLPLFVFWKWWASHVIPVFYGNNLGDLLSYSNTWFSYYEDADATLRIFSVFPDSHSFALSMLISIPIAVAYFVAEKERGARKLFFGVISAFYLMSIIFSGTRGIWVGAAPVFLLCLAVLFLPKSCNKILENCFGGIFAAILGARRHIKIGIISILIFFAFFPAVSQFLEVSQILQGGRISSSSTFERISSSLNRREISNRGRIEIWNSTWNSISERPWLGVGIGNYPAVLGENLSSTKEGASAHSLYLDVAAETGIFGVAALLLLFAEIFWMAIRTSVTVKDKFPSLFSGLFAVYFVWVMAYSVVDVALLNDKVLLFFVVSVALIHSISLKSGYKKQATNRGLNEF